MPAIPGLIEPLSDGAVSLRLAAERDIPEVLIAHDDDPQLYVDRGRERPPTGAELGRDMEEAAAERAAGSLETLTLLESGSDECRGQLYVHGIDWDHGRAELSLWVVPRARSRGLARAALRLAAAWLFEAWRIERVQLTTLPTNERMMRAALGAGFAQEGILRGYRRERGQRLDVAILSLLPADLERPKQ
jgi:RimJ/RimL family protein N-acetyltransferase